MLVCGGRGKLIKKKIRFFNHFFFFKIAAWSTLGLLTALQFAILMSWGYYGGSYDEEVQKMKVFIVYLLYRSIYLLSDLPI